ncbi:MAG: hypothetical protein KGL16_06775, partial [Acidobacteriota bacterium]|nr:hypothetical protein [Acidobacteriota bacterium]
MLAFVPYFASHLPSAAEIVELPPEVLGLTLLRLERERPQNEASLLSRSTVANPSFWVQQLGQEGTSVQFQRAMAEAWDWLVTHGLVSLKPMELSFSGWAYITRRGERVLDAAEPLELLRAEGRIGVDLHPVIADDVRVQFMLGKYELAALAALKAVEVRVRELAGA